MFGVVSAQPPLGAGGMDFSHPEAVLPRQASLPPVPLPAPSVARVTTGEPVVACRCGVLPHWVSYENHGREECSMGTESCSDPDGSQDSFADSSVRG